MVKYKDIFLKKVRKKGKSNSHSLEETFHDLFLCHCRRLCGLVSFLTVLAASAAYKSGFTSLSFISKSDPRIKPSPV